MIASFSARAWLDFCESGRKLASFYLSAAAFRNLPHDPHSGRDFEIREAFARGELDTLERVVERHPSVRTVRLGIALPQLGGPNTYVRPKDLPSSCSS